MLLPAVTLAIAMVAKALDVPYLLLRHLNMYESEEAEVTYKPKVYEHTVYLESEKDGLWYPGIKENDNVAKGQLLGYLGDIFGNKVQEFYAEGNGKVFYYTGGLAVKKGDSLVVYGLES